MSPVTFCRCFVLLHQSMPDETSYPMSLILICFVTGYHSSRERKYLWIRWGKCLCINIEVCSVATHKRDRDRLLLQVGPHLRTYISKGFLLRGTLYTNRTYIRAHFFVGQVYPRGLWPCIIVWQARVLSPVLQFPLTYPSMTIFPASKIILQN